MARDKLALLTQELFERQNIACSALTWCLQSPITALAQPFAPAGRKAAGPHSLSIHRAGEVVDPVDHDQLFANAVQNRPWCSGITSPVTAMVAKVVNLAPPVMATRGHVGHRVRVHWLDGLRCQHSLAGQSRTGLFQCHHLIPMGWCAPSTGVGVGGILPIAVVGDFRTLMGDTQLKPLFSVSRFLPKATKALRAL